MKEFKDYNPIILFLYFLLVTVICVFALSPEFTVISLLGAVLLDLKTNGFSGKRYISLFLLFLVLSLLNPFLYHNGVTVLFVLNNNPITLEAVLYGINASAMLVSVILWYASFRTVMTEDKLLYVFGHVSPHFALLFSMSLRYASLFSRQAKKVREVQTAQGLYSKDNIIDLMTSGGKVFSILLTWGLENGIITADSMAARGYGSGKRTFFSLYRFTVKDAVVLTTLLLLSGTVITGLVTKSVVFTFYPALTPALGSPLKIMSLISYLLISLLPVVLKRHGADR